MAKKQEEAKGSVGTSIRIPLELLKRLDALAAKERRSRGNLVRILLEDALQERGSFERT